MREDLDSTLERHECLKATAEVYSNWAPEKTRVGASQWDERPLPGTFERSELEINEREIKKYRSFLGEHRD